MKDEEKNLIENLFHRLKNTQSSSSERDSSAENLIQKLVENQPTSSYYMVQTILIQETAIKKMSLKIEELEKKINLSNKEESKKKPSFLSNFFKNNPPSQTISHDNNVWKKENCLHSNNLNPPVVSSTTQGLSTSSRSSSFLGNALQTATGVAGGMILGNMLMNVFNNHTNPEEEIFDTINKSSTDHIENNNFNDTSHNNLINHESNFNRNELHSDDNVYHSDDYSDDYSDDDTDINDDNFI